MSPDRPARQREWTGLDCPESQRAAEERQRWRQLVKEWTGLDCPESQRAVEETEMEAAGCEIIGGASMTLGVKGQIDREDLIYFTRITNCRGPYYFTRITHCRGPYLCYYFTRITHCRELYLLL